MRNFLVLAMALAAATSAFGQEKANNPGTILALQMLDARVFSKTDATQRAVSVRRLRDEFNKRDVEAWRAVKFRADWEKFRDERIARLRASLGKFPETPKSVKVVTTKKLEGEGFTIECLIYESRPGLFVTANLYLPKDTSKSMPGFILVHSHHNPKTQGELQDMGMMWARQGCMVLVPDMLGHGERRQHPFVDAGSFPEKFATSRQDYHFRYNVNLQLSLVGESLMGWMVWDLMRGVDVLYQRPNLDKSRVMVFGSVAGGGDPCAVFAALEPRITAAAPFNFGGPQPETKFPLPDDAELAFNYMGGGSWESTRSLKLSARDGFPAWLIVASIAPRGLIYGHEFAWDPTRDPVWARYKKIWGEFYGVKDKLAASAGRGSVKGKPPESTHCNNIGYEHRKPIYPTLKNWFGLPIPEENKKRLEGSELQCWTDEARKTLQPKMVHELVSEIAAAKGISPSDAGPATWQRLLGVPDLQQAKTATQVEDKTVGTPAKTFGFHLKKVVIRQKGNPDMAVPAVILRPEGAAEVSHVVVGIAQDGKAGFLKNRAATIATLLRNNVAVCLPDLRGTGETADEGRGRTSGASSYSATLLMHGRTVPGEQLRELRAVLDALSTQGYTSMALWGDSFAEPNASNATLAVPHDANVKMPRQSEPMGPLLALLGGMQGGARVKAIYARGGLVSFRSMLDSPFCYFPHDAVVPGILAETDIESLVLGNKKASLRMESLVDGRNRRVDQQELEKRYARLATVRAEPSSLEDVGAWLAAQVKK